MIARFSFTQHSPSCFLSACNDHKRTKFLLFLCDTDWPLLISSQIPWPLRSVSQPNARKYNSGYSESYPITHSKCECHFSWGFSLDKVKFWLRASMSTEMARLALNKQSKHRQQETNHSPFSTSARATRSNGPVVTPPAISHSSVPRRTTCLSPSSAHSLPSTHTLPSVSPLSKTPRSSPTHTENYWDVRRETLQSRVGSPPPSNSHHSASRSGRSPLLRNSTDETPRSSLSSERKSPRWEESDSPSCM